MDGEPRKSDRYWYSMDSYDAVASYQANLPGYNHPKENYMDFNTESREIFLETLRMYKD